MEYYKELYEHERVQGLSNAKSKGRAQGNILIADAILVTIDAFMDPDQFKDQIARVRNEIMKAYNELNQI